MLKTVGTDLWVRWRGEQFKVGKITALGNTGDEVAPRETTCLGDEYKSYQAGVRNLGQIDLTVDFTADGAHKKLVQAYHSGEDLEVYIGLGDGTSEPVFIQGNAVAENRSGFYQIGFINTDAWEFDDESYVSVTMPIQKRKRTTEAINASSIFVLGTGNAGEVLGSDGAELFAGYEL